jgi:hypothetical protein
MVVQGNQEGLEGHGRKGLAEWGYCEKLGE